MEQATCDSQGGVLGGICTRLGEFGVACQFKGACGNAPEAPPQQPTISTFRVLFDSVKTSYCGKHFPNATSSLSGPSSRIFRRSSAHTTFFSFRRKPIHVCESAVTCRSA